MNATETLCDGACLSITAPPSARIETIDAAWLRSAVRERGAVLLRGYRADVPAFERLVGSIADVPLVQAGGRERSSTSDVVQQVNPGAEAIGPHCENAFTPARPDLALFLCERPAAAGGETTITDGATVARDLVAAMPDFAGTRVQYRGVYKPEVWKRMFGTGRPAAARAALAGLRLMLARSGVVSFDFDLSDDGVLSYEYVTPPLVVCRRGERVFADSYAGFPTAPPRDGGSRPDAVWVTTADGRPYPEHVQKAIRSTLESHTHDVALAPGDVLVVDNWSVLHGRRRFTGTRIMHAAFAYASWLRPEERGPVPVQLGQPS